MMTELRSVPRTEEPTPRRKPTKEAHFTRRIPRRFWGADLVSRVVRFPVHTPPEKEWRELRRLGYLCASYGNKLLCDSYAQTRGLQRVDGGTTFKDAKDELSSAVRDAVGRECVGMWRRLGKKILRGQQTLGRFHADRAIVCRDRGLTVSTETIELRLFPEPKGRTVLSYYEKAFARDTFLSRLRERIASGEWPPKKAVLRFDGNRMDLLISYLRPIPRAQEGATATFTWSGAEMVIRFQGRTLSLNHEFHRLRSMKSNFEGIHRRLRKDLGKRGTRREHRRALAKCGGFEEWARGPLHQISSLLVKWTAEQGAAGIVYDGADIVDMPGAELGLLLHYKCQDAGMSFSQTSEGEKQNSGLRKNGDGKGGKESE